LIIGFFNIFQRIYNFLEVFIKFFKIKEFVLIGLCAFTIFAGCDQEGINGGGGSGNGSKGKFNDPIYAASYKESGKNTYIIYVNVEDHSADKNETQPVKHNFFVRGGRLSSDLLYKDVTARIIAAGDIAGGAYPIIKYKINADSYHVGVMSEDPYGNTSNLIWKQAEKITMNGSGSTSTKIKIIDIPDDVHFCEIWLSKNTELNYDAFVANGSNTVNSDSTATIVLYNYTTEDWNGSGTYYLFIEFNGVQRRNDPLIQITMSNNEISWDDFEFVTTRFDF